jgi:NADPH-dependent ferric siderophore reductase
MLGIVQVQALPIPPNLLSIPGVQPLELEVASASDLGPRMRRIELTAPSLANFEYQAGQDVMLILGQAGDRPLSRRYTIRSHDPLAKTLELNVVAHGVEGIGAQWAANAAPGDRVSGVGPRGKIYLDPDAVWHLFLGDETAGPVTLNMIEALPAETPAIGFVEVIDADDELPFRAVGQHRLTWLHRGATPAPSSTLLADALRTFELPAGRGHVYLNGEVVLVTNLKRAALDRGLDAEQVSFKAYWGRGKSNAVNGEPEQRPA